MSNHTTLYETLDATIAAAAIGRWNQDVWVEEIRASEAHLCGTAGCFAGWRAFLDGYTVLDDSYRVLINPITGDTLGIDGWDFDDGHISEHARQRLGITVEQARKLFSSENSLEDLKRIVDQIVAGEA